MRPVDLNVLIATVVCRQIESIPTVRQQQRVRVDVPKAGAYPLPNHCRIGIVTF